MKENGRALSNGTDMSTELEKFFLLPKKSDFIWSWEIMMLAFIMTSHRVNSIGILM